VRERKQTALGLAANNADTYAVPFRKFGRDTREPFIGPTLDRAPDRRTRRNGNQSVGIGNPSGSEKLAGRMTRILVRLHHPDIVLRCCLKSQILDQPQVILRRRRPTEWDELVQRKKRTEPAESGTYRRMSCSDQKQAVKGTRKRYGDIEVLTAQFAAQLHLFSPLPVRSDDHPVRKPGKTEQRCQIRPHSSEESHMW